MINLPNLPTDSLYKFTFMGGIVLLLSSLFLLKDNYSQVTSMLTNADSVIKSHRVQSEASFKIQEAKLKVLENAYHAGNRILGKDSILLSRPIPEMILKNRKRDLEESELVANKDSIRKMQQFHDETLIRHLIKAEYTNWHLFLIWVILTTGALMTSYGCFMWYYRIQLPQDKLLHMRVILMEKQLNGSESVNETP